MGFPPFCAEASLIMFEQTDEALMQALKRYPQLKQRIGHLLAVVEDAEGDLARADAAERRVIEEIRRLGQESLQAWAERQKWSRRQ